MTPTDQLVTCSRLVARNSNTELPSVIDRALQAEPHIGASGDEESRNIKHHLINLLSM
jgi:hypothetical protein